MRTTAPVMTFFERGAYQFVLCQVSGQLLKADSTIVNTVAINN